MYYLQSGQPFYRTVLESKICINAKEGTPTIPLPLTLQGSSCYFTIFLGNYSAKLYYTKPGRQKRTFLSSFSILGSTGGGCFPADEPGEAPASPPSPSSRFKLSPTVDVSAATAPALSRGPEPSVLARAELSCRLLVLLQQHALLRGSVTNGNCPRADATGRNAQLALPLSRRIAVEVSARRRQWRKGEGMGNGGSSRLHTLSQPRT